MNASAKGLEGLNGSKKKFEWGTLTLENPEISGKTRKSMRRSWVHILPNLVLIPSVLEDT
jgi:hypothetical protein